MVRENTPWEKYLLEGIPVYIKRDDLLNLEPNCPQYSKLRGLETYLKQLGKDTIGALDGGFHSRTGWAAAYIAMKLGIKAYVYYPVLVKEGTLENHDLREYQVEARGVGAYLVPLKAGRAMVMWYQARKHLANISDGEMLPTGLKLKKCAEGTEWEVVNYTPKELFCGTWLVAMSSGTTAAGVMRGIRPYNNQIRLVCYLGEHKNVDKMRKFMCKIAEYEPKELIYIDEGWEYKDFAAEEGIPFPASKWYEAKLWWWLKNHISELPKPIILWNI